MSDVSDTGVLMAAALICFALDDPFAGIFGIAFAVIAVNN